MRSTLQSPACWIMRGEWLAGQFPRPRSVQYGSRPQLADEM